MKLSRQIRAWRSFRGLTQSALAQKSEIPRPNLVDLEQGRRDCTVTTLAKLAHALEISPGTLLDQFPMPEVSLNRFEVDQIAKALCQMGSKDLPSDLESIKDLLGPVVAPLLRAGGVKSKEFPVKISRQTTSYLLRARDEMGEANLNRLIRRVSKLLASRT